nr:MAG TPA: hypothetical protein [Caudoviricetes sp.]DAY42085.1 MAG TPA: hypothetical protein [Caudoviricetes sp.]
MIFMYQAILIILLALFLIQYQILNLYICIMDKK